MSATELINPATEQVLGTVEHCDVAAVDDAIARAGTAQKRWAAQPPAERAAALRAFAAIVDAHIGELAALEVAKVPCIINSTSAEEERLLNVPLVRGCCCWQGRVCDARAP